MHGAGIPDLQSPQSRAGIYNLDPAVRFWATPPIDGCLRESVIHPAAFTFKLPDNVSFARGAMVEPLAIGMQSATKAGIKPGDIGLVIGAGTIGIITALCALAGGCSDVIICDVFDEKLKVAEKYQGLHAVNSKDQQALADKVRELTGGEGVNVLFECSGAKPVIASISDHIARAAPLFSSACLSTRTAGYRGGTGERSDLQNYFPLRQYVSAHHPSAELRQTECGTAAVRNLQVQRQCRSL